MIASFIDLHDVKAALRRMFDGQARTWVGLAFLVLATAAIQYDEFVAPSVGRLNDAWSMAATDFSRKLASFNL